MRLVWKPEDLLQQSKIARAEAQAAFGNDQIYLEKYFVNPRHIEVQVLADQYGSVVHLGERECSLQRGHQKLLEECPSPAVHDELRVQLGAAAVNGAKAVGYRNVGTMEFLLDADGKFYFMEMNTPYSGRTSRYRNGLWYRLGERAAAHSCGGAARV